MRAGLTITAGGFTVTAGGLTITDGDLTISSGRALITPGANSGTPAASAGSLFNVATSTFTDSATAMSGTATAFAAYSFNAPTLAATNTSVTTTAAATVYIDAAVIAGTNETLTATYALWVDAGVVRIDGAISLAATASAAIRGGSTETLIRNAGNSATLLKWTDTGVWSHTPVAASGTPGTTGSLYDIATSTFTDSATAMSGTAAAFAAYAFQAPTLAATNTSVTTTDAATLYVSAAPIAGTNQTLTNAYAFWNAGGTVRHDGSFRTGASTAEQAVIKGIYKSGTVAVTVPSIANDAAENIDSVDVDVASAFTIQPAVGDKVVAIPLAALPTDCLLLGAYVTNTDTVTVVFGSKEAGGGVTGAAVNFSFEVTDYT